MMDPQIQGTEEQPQSQVPDAGAQLEIERRARHEAEARAAQASAQAQQAAAYAQGLMGALQQQQQPPPPQQMYTPDDDVWADDPRKLQQFVQQQAAAQAQQIVQQTVAPVVQTYVTNQRLTNKRMAETDTSMPYFKKWEKEIEDVLNGVDPRIATLPDAYKAAYQLVSSFHTDEILEDRMKQRTQVQEDEEPYEPEPAPSYQSSAPAPSRFTEPPMPVSVARGQQRQQQPTRTPKLNQDERFWAQRSGMSAEEYRYYSDNDSEDIFGFKGRNRV